MNKCKMPPLGLTPRFIRDEQRFCEICDAISRYWDSGYPINIEWIEEYNELLLKIKKRQEKDGA